MKTIVVIFVICIDFVTNVEFLLRPNLPAGEYKAIFKGIMQCDPNQNYGIKFNLYLSKTSANTSQLYGNLTNTIAIDDSLNLEANMAVKDSIGGWKDNAFIYKSPNGCNQFKTFLGKMWYKVIKGFNINGINCPIRTGIYKSNGVDTGTIISESDLPKVFFYGTYKLRLFFTQNKKVVSCIIFVIDVKRPWDLD